MWRLLWRLQKHHEDATPPPQHKNFRHFSPMHKHNWSFCIHTFGCKVNQYESQSLREAWLGMCGEETDAPAAADVILLNTCAVTANAVADARQSVRRLHREAPHAAIVVTGCASEVAREQLTALPGVVRVVGQDDKPRLLEASTLCEWLSPVACSISPKTGVTGVSETGVVSDEPSTQTATARTFPPFQIEGFRRARPVLKVQDGCSHGCAYCIVPLTRGPSRSRTPQDCLDEARRLLAAGYREIMLSGINLRQYAMREQGCADFWELVRFLDRELAPEWSTSARLRISSVDPAQLDERGLDCLSQTRMICPHLHLSLQSGSPDVLQAMRRGHYTPERLIETVQTVAGYWPRLGLGADILMGFPGETEAHVRETLAVVQELPLTYAHVFPFSARPGTLAARLPLQVAKAERQHRAALVRALVEASREAFWRQTLTLDTLLVALDSNEENLPLKATVPATPLGQHGVDACYTPCRLRTPLYGHGHALLAVRPVRLDTDGLIVEPYSA